MPADPEVGDGHAVGQRLLRQPTDDLAAEGVVAQEDVADAGDERALRHDGRLHRWLQRGELVGLEVEVAALGTVEVGRRVVVDGDGHERLVVDALEDGLDRGDAAGQEEVHRVGAADRDAGGPTSPSRSARLRPRPCAISGATRASGSQTEGGRSPSGVAEGRSAAVATVVVSRRHDRGPVGRAGELGQAGGPPAAGASGRPDRRLAQVADRAVEAVEDLGRHRRRPGR